jgi:excisionase family DNA binding protein
VTDPQQFDRRPEDGQTPSHPQPSPSDATGTPPLKSGRQRNRRDLPESLKEHQQVNADQLADLLCISKRQVFRWLADGHLPPYDLTIGQTRRWRLATIRAWLERGGRRRRAS